MKKSDRNLIEAGEREGSLQNTGSMLRIKEICKKHMEWQETEVSRKQKVRSNTTHLKKAQKTKVLSHPLYI